MMAWVQLDALQWLSVSWAKSCIRNVDVIQAVECWETWCGSCLPGCLGCPCPWTCLASLEAANDESTAPAKTADPGSE